MGSPKMAMPVSVSPWSPASQGDPPRSAGGADLGSFHIPASALDPRMSESLCAPHKSGGCFPLGLPEVNLADLQGQMFRGACLLGEGPLAWGTQCGLTFAPWGELLQLQLFSCSWVTHLGVWDMGLNCTVFPALLPISLRFLLFFLSKILFILIVVHGL